MSGRRAGAGEPGSRGPRHVAAMQLFHELKQQFPALPDHAVSACVARHLHDPRLCHSQLQLASTPRSLPYPTELRQDEHQQANTYPDLMDQELPSTTAELLPPKVLTPTGRTDSEKNTQSESILRSPKIGRRETEKKALLPSLSNSEAQTESSDEPASRSTLRNPKILSPIARSESEKKTQSESSEELTSRSFLRSPKVGRRESEKKALLPCVSSSESKTESSDESAYRNVSRSHKILSPIGRRETEKKALLPSLSSSETATESSEELASRSILRSPKVPPPIGRRETEKKALLSCVSSSEAQTESIDEPASRSILRSPKMDFKKCSLSQQVNTFSAVSSKRTSESSDELGRRVLLSLSTPETQTSSDKSILRSGKMEGIDEPKMLSPIGRRKFERKATESSDRTILRSPKEEVTPSSAVRNERTSPTSPSDAKDYSPFSSKPPMSPSTSKKPPGRLSKPYDARILKLPEDSLTNASGAVRRSSAVRPASLDLPRRTSDSADSKTSPVQGVNLSVNVNCSVGVVEPGNGQSARRHSAVLEVTPEPTWLHSYPPSPRSYTSVNLTLRTPTTPPQGPIDICSSPAPASLTYTTSSFDRRQGLQSRLQITVGPGAGSVTASRTRPRSCYQDQGEHGRGEMRAESMPDLSGELRSTNHVVLLSRQKERKEQLRNELKAGKERLHSIQKEIQALRLENTPEYRTKLKKEIRHLQAQCERLTREVDRHSESRVPLGETNEEFYRHIYTGQRPPLQRRRGPPAPSTPHHAAHEPDNEPRWPCHICTFRNHPLMDKCEQCEMPRVLLVSAGPGENIHIRFSPGNTTRVIHSWVV